VPPAPDEGPPELRQEIEGGPWCVYDLVRLSRHQTTGNPRTVHPPRSSETTPTHNTLVFQYVAQHLGPTPVTLPDPVADLTLRLLASQRGHATTGANEPSPWLFPGGQPGRPINATHLGQRLKAIGIQPGQARSTALFHLATELPAALLARMLGIHIAVAVAWQRASSGDWANYAAEVSRRQQR